MREFCQLDGENGPTERTKKAKEILKALAAGRTCEQVLARDRTLTYHDVFHAVSEAPTSHWKKKRAAKKDVKR